MRYLLAFLSIINPIELFAFHTGRTSSWLSLDSHLRGYSEEVWIWPTTPRLVDLEGIGLYGSQELAKS